MTTNARYLLVFLALCLSSTAALAASPADPYIGRWALTIPGGAAGWLGVEQKDGYLDASILWGGGSVVPVPVTPFVVNDELFVMRLQNVEHRNDAGEVARTLMLPEVLRARVYGDTMELTRIQPHRDGIGIDEQNFTGKRIPPLPPAPDLSSVKRGKPVVLFDGTTLDKWKLVNANNTSAWTIEDGILINKVAPRRRGSPQVHYGNLRTVDEFEDFNLKLEVKVDQRQNSGVYLRGIYEVQVTDSYGRDLDSHNMGGIYSRITPTVAAEKPAGQWQTMDITLCDRHVTVILNGKNIIDNQPLLGCTGGALSSDEFKPGPIYLQGDHTAVSYRNIVLTPITK